jgi:hypothetical protein
MQSPKSRPLPRKITVSLLWMYVVMGLASIGIGLALGITAYHIRMDGSKQGTGYVMLVAGVVIAFGIWRCALAGYHLRRIGRSQPK